MPGRKQACPISAACWSPAIAANRQRRAEDARARSSPNVGRAVAHLGQHRARHAEQRRAVVVPVAAMDVEQQRARGVGGVGGVHARRRSGARAEKLSTVPKASSPRSARARAPATLSSIQAILVAEK